MLYGMSRKTLVIAFWLSRFESSNLLMKWLIFDVNIPNMQYLTRLHR